MLCVRVMNGLRRQGADGATAHECMHGVSSIMCRVGSGAAGWVLWQARIRLCRVRVRGVVRVCSRCNSMSCGRAGAGAAGQWHNMQVLRC